MRRIKDLAKRLLFEAYRFGTRLGVHILPVHYYSPLPDILALEKNRDVWAKKSELPGMAVDLDAQGEFLRSVCLPFQKEYLGNRIYEEGVKSRFGPGYGFIEAQALHSVIRHFKPRRIIEVGSGVSTYCMLKATELNVAETGLNTNITAIEPYPSDALQQTRAIELIARPVQTVPLEEFRKLESGDLLFIDSSHTVKPGGDVNFLILEVLPRLKPGVIIHVHDITFPYDYQRDVLQTFLHWTESSLLRAFLTFNDRVRILASLSQLHYDRKDVLRAVFPEYEPQSDVNGMRPSNEKPFATRKGHFPSSIYLQMTEPGGVANLP